MSLLPIFRSHYSIGNSLLTFDAPGSAKPGNPLSVFDLAKDLSEVVVADERIDGYIEAYKAADKEKKKLCFGIKFKVVPDCADKSQESIKNESSVIVFFRNYEGYRDMIKLYSRAWGAEGSFVSKVKGREQIYGRVDWKMLKECWTANFKIAFPFFSSFIARNTMTMASIVADLAFVENLTFFIEKNSGLPFDFLIENAVKRYIKDKESAQVVDCKTILYPTKAHIEAFVTLRALHSHTTFDEPNVQHLHSNEFSWESYKELAQ